MIRRRRALRIMVSAAVTMAAANAEAQGLGRGKGNSGPPVENHPKVDEKAYKAALDRIPVPAEKYDPWSGVHATGTSKPPKKPN